MSDESEHLIEQAEAEEFMSRVMSNLDGGKDAEIDRLRTTLHHLIETWHCGDIKPEDIADASLTLAGKPQRTCATCNAVLAVGPQPAATYVEVPADSLANFLWTTGLKERQSAQLARDMLDNFHIRRR